MRNKIWIVCFFILLIGPFVFELILGDYLKTIDYGIRNAAYTYFYNGQYVNTAEGAQEKEYEIPQLRLRGMRGLPKEYEEYFDNILPLKKLYIRINSTINYYLFGESTNEKVVVGKEDWLFYKSAIKTSMGYWEFTDEELKEIADNLTYEKAVLESQNIDFYVLIAPNKETIYSEYLPKNWPPKRNDSPAEQLVKYLNDNTDVKVIFPKTELLAQKKTTPDIVLYHKLDTHWNSAGAYVAAKALANVMGKDLPDLAQISKKPLYFSGSDLTNMIGMPIKNASCDYSLSGFGEGDTVLDEWEYSELIKYHNDKETGNIFVYRDSFSSALSQHLSTLYANSVYANHDTPQQQIFDAASDIVVLERVERKVKTLGNREISFVNSEIVSEGEARYLSIQLIVPNDAGYRITVDKYAAESGEYIRCIESEPISNSIDYAIEEGEQGRFEIIITNDCGQIVEKKSIEF